MNLSIKPLPNEGEEEKGERVDIVTVNGGTEFINVPPRGDRINGILLESTDDEPKNDDEPEGVQTPAPNVIKHLKRMLSPDDETKIGRIRKQSTTEDSSPALRGRNIDWSKHRYELSNKTPIVKNPVTGESVDKSERNIVTPRRRLLTVGSMFNSPTSDGLTGRPRSSTIGTPGGSKCNRKKMGRKKKTVVPQLENQRLISAYLTPPRGGNSGNNGGENPRMSNN